MSELAGMRFVSENHDLHAHDYTFGMQAVLVGETRMHRDIASWRVAVAKRRLHPYEALMGGEGPDRVPHADPAKARTFWLRPGMRPGDLEPPIAWDELLVDDRSQHFHLHALDPIGLPLAAHSHSPDRRWIEFALPLALDWLDAYSDRETESPFAWYDMAVGLRAYRLGYLLDVVARDDAWADRPVKRLHDGLRKHLEVLADDEQFAGHNNHGLYQAAGQLALVRRFPEFDEKGAYRRQAKGRLTDMLAAQFNDDGVHTEHSPGYHRMILATFAQLVDSGIVDEPAAVANVERIEEALAWFVRPDGMLVTIGDTDPKPLEPGRFGCASSAKLRLMATRGGSGTPQCTQVRAFPESGYVVFRERWPSGQDDFDQGAYLAQICGFHSRAHKHADDLSFVWWERGQELLIDPGRFAYKNAGEVPPELARLGHMYSDPQRIYVESTRAHNTVEIDRKSHNRRAEPYGSALDSCGKRRGTFWSRASVTFDGRIDHIRMLLLRPGDFLLVLDHLYDRTGASHRFSQRFHVAPELRTRATHQGLTLFSEVQSIPPLHVCSLDDARFSGVARGQEKPELLGWMSRKAGAVEPTSTFAFERENVPRAQFTTLFFWDRESDREGATTGAPAEGAGAPHRSA